MQDSVYLGDLGGLSAHRQLIRLDLRGTVSRRYQRRPPPIAATDSSRMWTACANTSAST